MPENRMRRLFAGIDRGARLLGLQSPASPEAVNFLVRPHPYSCSKARKQLGYTPKVSLEEGMDRLEQSLRSEGLI